MGRNPTPWVRSFNLVFFRQFFVLGVLFLCVYARQVVGRCAEAQAPGAMSSPPVWGWKAETHPPPRHLLMPLRVPAWKQPFTST